MTNAKRPDSQESPTRPPTVAECVAAVDRAQRDLATAQTNLAHARSSVARYEEDIPQHEEDLAKAKAALLSALDIPDQEQAVRIHGRFS